MESAPPSDHSGIDAVRLALSSETNGRQIVDLLQETLKCGASDLHLAAGRPPVLRIDGNLISIDAPSLTPKDTRQLIEAILTDEQKELLEERRDLDFAYSVPGVGRFRVNVHYQRGSLAAALRVIPSRILGFDALGLPGDILQSLCMCPHGLMLVTGPTGSGKTTTLAAMIDYINRTRSCHIVTIEDPIEFTHRHNKAVIEQREVYTDTPTFASALKHVLRQDPDVILVGEMRDLETTAATLTAAETGHFVVSTLHTVDVAQTVDRVIDIFPAHQRTQIQLQMSMLLQAILSQKLLPRATGSGRVPAIELLLVNDAIRNLIREGKTHQLDSQIESGRQYGMQSMERALLELYRRGLVSKQEALANVTKPDELKKKLDKMTTIVYQPFNPASGTGKS